MNNDNASWVNGEDLKYEYTYFSKDMIAGEKTVLVTRQCYHKASSTSYFDFNKRRQFPLNCFTGLTKKTERNLVCVTDPEQT